MEEIVIRKATINDLEQLYPFEQGVIAAERPYDPTLKEELIHYYDIKEMIEAPHIELVVAEVNNKLIASGYARIEKVEPFLKHDSHAWLGFMFVHPDYRGHGINKKIIDVLKNWALSQNVKELRLQVYFDNLSAIKAYEKIGFSKHMIEMRFNLED